ncbi:MAG: hypothetical protein JWO90_1976, partial [Solirubrobacterales bacterium]|nr:hypothetical protein [Solirubrobacterales bacterium]
MKLCAVGRAAALAVPLSALVALGAGCGSDDESDTTSAAATGAQSTTTAAAVAKAQVAP